MRAIIIAAGRGSRLGSITNNLPKPLVEINGKSILERQILFFNQMGINDIVIVTGYKRNKIKFKNIHYVVNNEYSATEQLFSLMKARDFFTGELIISYGDIIYNKRILNKIVSQESSFLLAVDPDWKQSYEERSDNPAMLADFVGLDKGKVTKFFTNLNKESSIPSRVVEFIGLMKLSPNASRLFLEEYLSMEDLNSNSVKRLKIINFLEILRKSEVDISTFNVQDDWCEIDTVQDLEIARKIFA